MRHRPTPTGTPGNRPGFQAKELPAFPAVTAPWINTLRRLADGPQPVDIDQGDDDPANPYGRQMAERHPHRWSPRWWPITWRLVGWLYALGVIAGSRWHSPGGMRRAYVTLTWRDLRGRRPYVLGWPAWKWHCLLRAHHWPGEPIGLGLCAKCAPCPECGSTVAACPPTCPTREGR